MRNVSQLRMFRGLARGPPMGATSSSLQADLRVIGEVFTVKFWLHQILLRSGRCHCRGGCSQNH